MDSPPKPFQPSSAPPPHTSTSSPGQLNVIALISGGKDSFFSVLHCMKNGHRVVALANLFPAPATDPSGPAANKSTGQHLSPTVIIDPSSAAATGGEGDHVVSQVSAQEDTDLNSFMYQTVGHQVIPLYAPATGLPLYRQPIHGGARHAGRDYDAHHVAPADPVATPSSAGAAGDETEDMIPLLKTVMARHPEANALCAGAILSTYQRTRVESVALRLGLTPLAYLWKYTVLPPPLPGTPSDDAQLLMDMAAAGLDARIIKVASAGLDEDILWETASSIRGATKIKKGLRKFGAAEGSVIGEGGEFETIVIDGPKQLFCNKISVPGPARRIVREGGGTSWLNFLDGRAQVVEKEVAEEDNAELNIRLPSLWDDQFEHVVASLRDVNVSDLTEGTVSLSAAEPVAQAEPQVLGPRSFQQQMSWTVSARDASTTSIEDETKVIMTRIEDLLNDPKNPSPLPTTAITNTIIVLRNMSDFPTINNIYGGLFKHPNPPSRITISCGDLLPDDCNIIIHLTVHGGLNPDQRRGLHVQSRSYWAPANIGPYSQAIEIPLFFSLNGTSSEGSESGVRSITIAGQIPLWPATMSIPSEADIQSQTALSLQHLWRIAADQKIQLWTSAVAYFPRTPSDQEMKQKACLAAVAWKAAHMFTKGDDEDDDAGPDLWDRRYNSQFMTFGDAAESGPGASLPDRSVMKNSGEDDDYEFPAPPFFAVEVEELPRQAGIEWHAHTGLSGLSASTVDVTSASFTVPYGGDILRCHTSHTRVSSALVGSTVAVEAISGDDPTFRSTEDLQSLVKQSYLKSLGWKNTSVSTMAQANLLYISRREHPDVAVPSIHDDGRVSTAVVPCRSIWPATGTNLATVAVFGPLSWSDAS